MMSSTNLGLFATDTLMVATTDVAMQIMSHPLMTAGIFLLILCTLTVIRQNLECCDRE
jgi:hypothetical protein